MLGVAVLLMLATHVADCSGCFIEAEHHNIARTLRTGDHAIQTGKIVAVLDRAGAGGNRNLHDGKAPVVVMLAPLLAAPVRPAAAPGVAAYAFAAGRNTALAHRKLAALLI